MTRQRLAELGFSLCLCVVVVGSARAATPALNAINPRGAQRGTDAVLTFSGGRLSDAQEVHVYYPGITVSKLEVVNDATLKVTVKIAPDCRLGEPAPRAPCISGVSPIAPL